MAPVNDTQVSRTKRRTNQSMHTLKFSPV